MINTATSSKLLVALNSKKEWWDEELRASSVSSKLQVMFPACWMYFEISNCSCASDQAQMIATCKLCKIHMRLSRSIHSIVPRQNWTRIDTTCVWNRWGWVVIEDMLACLHTFIIQSVHAWPWAITPKDEAGHTATVRTGNIFFCLRGAITFSSLQYCLEPRRQESKQAMRVRLDKEVKD